MDDPLDHHRLPVMTMTRRLRGERGWLIAGLVPVLVLAGCATAGPSPSARSSSSPPTVAPSLESAPSTRPSGTSPVAATPIPEAAGIPVPLDEVTLVCESWGSEPPATAIPCRDAASLALGALGPSAAARVDRLDVGFGAGCQLKPTCPDRRADVGWVLARSGDRGWQLFDVERNASGELEVWPPVSSPPRPAPAFEPPPRAAPDLGTDAPGALRDREALPFCGEEDLGPTGAYDVAARRCFVDGVLAGSPVELISRAPSTEGDPVLTLYRFGGGGSVVRSVHAGGRWVTSVCAVSPIATDAAFVIAGGCDAAKP